MQSYEVLCRCYNIVIESVLFDTEELYFDVEPSINNRKVFDLIIDNSIRDIDGMTDPIHYRSTMEKVVPYSDFDRYKTYEPNQTIIDLIVDYIMSKFQPDMLQLVILLQSKFENILRFIPIESESELLDKMTMCAIRYKIKMFKLIMESVYKKINN